MGDDNKIITIAAYGLLDCSSSAKFIAVKVQMFRNVQKGALVCGLPKEELRNVVLMLLVANVTVSWARQAKNRMLTRGMIVKIICAHI